MEKPTISSIVADRVKRYVVGFMFDEHGGHIALVRKNRPDWQRGMLNGIGGKVEYGEIPINAMKREFLEETGVDCDEWESVGVCNWNRPPPSFGSYEQLYIFKAFTEEIWKIQTVTDEHVFVLQQPLDDHSYDMVPSLSWMIPMCMDSEIETVQINMRKTT